MRTLLGIALRGFWVMSAAVAMRLVPLKLVPRALSIIFNDIVVGTVVSVPLGSYLGGLFSWRSHRRITYLIMPVSLVYSSQQASQ